MSVTIDPSIQNDLENLRAGEYGDGNGYEYHRVLGYIQLLEEFVRQTRPDDAAAMLAKFVRGAAVYEAAEFEATHLRVLNLLS